VQGAARTLIECLIFKRDFDHAGTFAQMTLDSLKDPVNGLDQQSKAVAKRYYDLGNVIYKQDGDNEKAEKLVRESLRIRSRLYDTHHLLVGISIDLLTSILLEQGRLGSEAQELHEHSLAINSKHFGSEAMDTAASNFNLGIFYHLRAEESQSAETMKDHLQLSESKFKESLRICTKVFGSDHPRAVRASSFIHHFTGAI
jgi:tetratricopeptide (TPR) repeat protein